MDGKWALKGRPREKGFLYDLVSNKFDGLDVDKLDYFLRDSHHANVNVKLDTVRPKFTKFSRFPL